MTDDPRTELTRLERDFLEEPLFIRKRELTKINLLRRELGAPEVDVELRPVATSAPAAPPPVARPAPAIDRHVRARGLHDRFLTREAALEPHRAWAQRMLRELTPRKGDGRTPVRPLATGSRGGPIRCDVCESTFPLEGSGVQGVSADVALARNPRDDFRSFISGGLVLELQPNGTLRFFHGDASSRGGSCYTRGQAADAAARGAWRRTDEPGAHAALLAFAQAELGLTEQDARVRAQEVLAAIYGYDPGLGVNGP